MFLYSQSSSPFITAGGSRACRDRRAPSWWRGYRCPCPHMKRLCMGTPLKELLLRLLPLLLQRPECPSSCQRDFLRAPPGALHSIQTLTTAFPPPPHPHTPATAGTQRRSWCTKHPPPHPGPESTPGVPVLPPSHCAETQRAVTSIVYCLSPPQMTTPMIFLC